MTSEKGVIITGRHPRDTVEDGYLFFWRELQKSCSGATITEQVSSRIERDRLLHEEDS